MLAQVAPSDLFNKKERQEEEEEEEEWRGPMARGGVEMEADCEREAGAAVG